MERNVALTSFCGQRGAFLRWFYKTSVLIYGFINDSVENEIRGVIS